MSAFAATGLMYAANTASLFDHLVGTRQCRSRRGEGQHLGGVDRRPPQAAVAKSDAGERCGKRRDKIPAGTVEGGERKRTAAEVSKADEPMSDPRGDPPPGSAWGMPKDCPSDIRHVGGSKLDLACVWNVRTWPAMPREKAQAAPTARPKVPMRQIGADAP